MPAELGSFDAIIVGSRIAGCITAAGLAKHGWRVLVVDRVAFPRSTLSTHLFFSDTLLALHAFGLHVPVLAIPAPRIRWLRFPYAEAPFPNHGGYDFALCIRREILDTVLVEQLGTRTEITFLTRARARDLLWADGRVRGVVVEYAGREWRAQAPLVVGADGRDSTIARLVGARSYDRVPPLFAWYYTYYEGLAVDPEPAALAFRGTYPEIGAEYAAAFLFPADHGLTLVGYGVEHRAFRAFRTEVYRHFEQGLAKIPAAWERVCSGRRVAPIRGTGQLPNFFRTAHGPGWVLVGDAGCHKDPHTVQGMGDAARSARMLVEELATTDPATSALDQALARYATRRDHDLQPMYDFTTFRLRQRIPEAIWERFEARSREDPELAALRIAAMVHAIDPRAVYSEEQLTQLATGKPIDPPGRSTSAQNERL
ncbi:NAD(P)/FAD-dependent oxidoreductase [Thermomicrobium sp. 4228-Ro]|uniref:NAD(P)/FAD-dependent oxidoreductase n=1 Tax=Thermomicrobium sp. 4228-Ro TaxID=2993937 RepID=UPI0022491193|nr:NAD(P)/FAD-dependent oxidoreductase [Thermomicrobium sp. 4228-Ro]MCX2726302.1 NAD(P)/FAD-dependent oxidoreductase [Thermomicrobium sp. 4228-Ro]